MKKIIIILLTTICIILPIWVFADWCEFDQNSTDIWSMVGNCINGSDLVNRNNTEIDNWFQVFINDIVWKIWTYLWILAIWAIVYGSLLMVFSTWDDEKIKKAKDIIKWSLIGFLGVIFASSIILLVVNVIYSLSE